MKRRTKAVIMTIIMIITLALTIVLTTVDWTPLSIFIPIITIMVAICVEVYDIKLMLEGRYDDEEA